MIEFAMKYSLKVEMGYRRAEASDGEDIRWTDRYTYSYTLALSKARSPLEVTIAAQLHHLAHPDRTDNSFSKPDFHCFALCIMELEMLS